MGELTAEDQAALAQQPFEVLAVGWDLLNTWKWPDWLPDEEKPTWEILESGGGRRRAACRWIEEAIGMRACFRYSSPWKDCPEEEFNDFWRGCFEGHAPSKERYWQRLEDKCGVPRGTHKRV